MNSDTHLADTIIAALLTLKQAADTLQVSTKTVRRWIDVGDLVAHRLGGKLRISEADLQTFIRRRREALPGLMLKRSAYAPGKQAVVAGCYNFGAMVQGSSWTLTRLAAFSPWLMFLPTSDLSPSTRPSKCRGCVSLG